MATKAEINRLAKMYKQHINQSRKFTGTDAAYQLGIASGIRQGVLSLATIEQYKLFKELVKGYES